MGMGQRHYSSTWINSKTWIGHGDLTFTYITCATTLRCHLLQALQEFFWKIERFNNGKKQLSWTWQGLTRWMGGQGLIAIHEFFF